MLKRQSRRCDGPRSYFLAVLSLSAAVQGIHPRLHPFTWLRGMSATHHSIQPDILKIRQTTPAKHECTQPTIVCIQCDRCVISRVRALSGSSTVVEHLNQPL